MFKLAMRGMKRRALRHLGIDMLAERLAGVSAQVQGVGASVGDRLAGVSDRVQGVESQVAAVRSRADVLSEMSATCARVEEHLKTATEGRELLAAQKDGRVIKLEYPPSYDLRPRWGYTRPPHAGLTARFARQKDEYLREIGRMNDMVPRFREIARYFSHDRPGEAGWLGGPVNCLDTALLYHIFATRRPKTYLEIGSGLTTMFAARAKKDFGLNTKLISIDPNPRGWVDGLCDVVVREPFECGDLSAFDALEPGDIVFMDGSHRTFMNSDVTVFLLDVLPNLKPGVIVHFHDIALPWDYPDMFVNWYWSEQYILAAYLIAAGDRIDYLMPAYYATTLPEFRPAIAPILDWWGGAERSDMWLSGGSMWFTHR